LAKALYVYSGAIHRGTSYAWQEQDFFYSNIELCMLEGARAQIWSWDSQRACSNVNIGVNIVDTCGLVDKTLHIVSGKVICHTVRHPRYVCVLELTECHSRQCKTTTHGVGA